MMVRFSLYDKPYTACHKNFFCGKGLSDMGVQVMDGFGFGQEIDSSFRGMTNGSVGESFGGMTNGSAGMIRLSA